MTTGPGTPTNGEEPVAMLPGGGYRPLDMTRPHPARRYDFWLGGKDNFAADRESADRIAREFPTIRTAVPENRRFLNRAVSFLAAEAGIRQFLDIGTGIPFFFYGYGDERGLPSFPRGGSSAFGTWSGRHGRASG